MCGDGRSNIKAQILVQKYFYHPVCEKVSRSCLPRPPSFWRAGQYVHTAITAPVPAAAVEKLLLNFFSKKLRVQGGALPMPA